MAHSRRDNRGLHDAYVFERIMLLMNGHEDGRRAMWVSVICCKKEGLG